MFQTTNQISIDSVLGIAWNSMIGLGEAVFILLRKLFNKGCPVYPL